MKASKLEEIEFAMMWSDREPISEGEIEKVLNKLFGEANETDQEPVQPSETE